MKAVINEKETPVSDEYPKLMVPKTGIQEFGIGIIIALSEDEVFHLTGSFEFEYAKGFFRLKDDFTPFTGTITISND